MKRFVWMPTVAVVLSVALGMPRGLAEDKKVGKGAAAASKEFFCVVQIGYDVKVVKKSELAALRKQVAKESKEAVEAYRAERREARKAKLEFAKQRPKRKSVKVISSSLKTEEEAEALRDKTVTKINGYSVVKIGEEVRILRQSELSELRKELAASHKSALQEFEKERKRAKRQKEAFRERKPVKIKVKVLATGLPSEAAARKRLAKLDKRASPKRTKKRPTEEDDTDETSEDGETAEEETSKDEDAGEEG